MQQIVGIGLAGDQGGRFHPLTLKAKGYLRSKAAVLLLGRRVLDWILDTLKSQGIEDFIMSTKGKENRYQIKNMVGYGDALGIRVRYSLVSQARLDTGSADTLFSNIEYFNLRDTLLVFPTDSVLDCDIAAMFAEHRRHGAVVTIVATDKPAEMISGQYGLLHCRDDGRVEQFIEKPSREQIEVIYGNIGTAPRLPANTGYYLMDAAVLHEISRHPDIVAMRKQSCDIGDHLLPWLLAHDYPVYMHRVPRLGELGDISGYLATMSDILHGRLAIAHRLLVHGYPGAAGRMIEPESLALTDPRTGLTLAEKIVAGLVTIRPPVRIGKYVQIYPGAVLSECNIDDDCVIHENVVIDRSSIGPGSLIGDDSVVEETLLGFMVELQSTREAPIRTHRCVAIGDEVVIQEGVELSDGVLIHPRLKIPRCCRIPVHAEIESVEQVLALI